MPPDPAPASLSTLDKAQAPELEANRYATKEEEGTGKRLKGTQTKRVKPKSRSKSNSLQIAKG
jgi:hypothetical protein